MTIREGSEGDGYKDDYGPFTSDDLVKLLLLESDVEDLYEEGFTGKYEDYSQRFVSSVSQKEEGKLSWRRNATDVEGRAFTEQVEDR